MWHFYEAKLWEPIVALSWVFPIRSRVLCVCWEALRAGEGNVPSCPEVHSVGAHSQQAPTEGGSVGTVLTGAPDLRSGTTWPRPATLVCRRGSRVFRLKVRCPCGSLKVVTHLLPSSGAQGCPKDATCGESSRKQTCLAQSKQPGGGVFYFQGFRTKQTYVRRKHQPCSAFQTLGPQRRLPSPSHTCPVATGGHMCICIPLGCMCAQML